MHKHDSLNEVLALGYKLLDEWLDQASGIRRIQPDVTGPSLRQAVSFLVEPLRSLDGPLGELAARRVQIDAAAHRPPGAVDPLLRRVPFIFFRAVTSFRRRGQQ